jgi:hypothetical protein
VADLESEIEERIEHVLDQFFQTLVDSMGSPWKEKEKVDVGTGIEQAAPVTAVSHEGDVTGHGGAENRGLEQGTEKSVYYGGTESSHLAPAAPLIVHLLEAGILLRHVILVEKQSFARGKFHESIGIEDLGDGIGGHLGCHGASVGEGRRNGKFANEDLQEWRCDDWSGAGCPVSTDGRTDP